MRLFLTVGYGLYGKVSRLAEDCVGAVLSLDFLAEVSLCLPFRAEDSARFLAALTELSGDSLTPDNAETLTCAGRDGRLTPIQLSAC